MAFRFKNILLSFLILFTVVEVYGQEPTIQITNLSVSNISCNSALLQWTNGNGDRRIIIMKEASAVDQNPSDGSSYSTSPVFGSGEELGTGNYVVFIGPVSLVNVQGLKPNTTYHVKAYEYNENGGSPDYLPTAPPVTSFSTYGFSVDFDFSYADSCWYNNNFNFTNNSVSTLPSTTYIWNFGDGQTSNDLNPSHSYASGNEYEVSLTIFPNYGCKDTFKTSLLVIPKPVIDIGVDDSAQCLTGNYFTFINNTSYPNINSLGLTRTWNFGDGTTAVTNKPQKVYATDDSFTVYNYVEMVYNNLPTGCYDTASLELIVFPDPAGSVTVSDTIQCIGKNGLTFDNPVANIIDYQWDLGDMNTASTKTVTHSYTNPGDYTVVHRAESSFGCVSRDTVRVIARNRRISSFVGLSGPICFSNSSISLTPSDASGTFYGKGVNGLSYTPANIGRDTVTYVVADNFCPDTTMVIVDVLAAPQPNIGMDQNLCNQSSFTLQEGISGAYLWSDGSTNPSLDVTTTGTYWLEVDDGTCKGRDSAYIYFGIPPVLPSISDTFLCKNSFISFNFSNFDTRYLWNDGSRDSSRVITSGGLYSVTASNPCGTSNATFNINQLDEDCNVLMPNAFSPNDDGKNDIFTPTLLSDSIIVTKFLIFNTYGEILFEGKDQNIIWDGTYQNSKVMGNKNYFYLLYYTLPIPENTQKGKLTGSVFLIR